MNKLFPLAVAFLFLLSPASQAKVNNIAPLVGTYSGDSAGLESGDYVRSHVTLKVLSSGTVIGSYTLTVTPRGSTDTKAYPGGLYGKIKRVYFHKFQNKAKVFLNAGYSGDFRVFRASRRGKCIVQQPTWGEDGFGFLTLKKTSK